MFQVSESFIGFPEYIINVEQANLLHSLQKCLELREKYMLKSRQRLGDDYDGQFQLLGDGYADVSGVRPDFPLHGKHRLNKHVQSYPPNHRLRTGTRKTKKL